MPCYVVIQGFKIAHIIDCVQYLGLPMPIPGLLDSAGSAPFAFGVRNSIVWKY